jgi:hypothetical protein
MAVNVQVYDLQNYSDNNKTVTIDIKQVTPIGYEGDEQWVVTATTTAYSDIAARTAISDIFILEMKGGWAKSSGLKTSPFTIGASNNKFRLRMDADVASGTDPQVQSGYWEITLTSSGVVTGDDVASDMETQIRLLADNVDMDATYALSYMNASVEFNEDKFKIISGSISESYSGADRSSVHIYGSSFSNSAHLDLGFSIPVSSYTVATSLADFVKETSLASTYTAGDPTMDTNFPGSTTVSGYCFYVSNGTVGEYFYCDGGTPSAMVVHPTLANTYNAAASKVQLIAWQDPDVAPINYYQDVDAGVRWAIKSLANQIDYSS